MSLAYIMEKPDQHNAGQIVPDNSSNNRLLNEKEIAEQLNVTPSCLQAWRYRGDGPPFIKISSRCVRYQSIDLQVWIDQRRCSSTSTLQGRA